MKKFMGLMCVVALFVGCAKETKVSPVSSKAPFVMSLAYSEYPSWSVFGVAEKHGLIDGAKGKQGSLELKNNVDIVLKLVDYDMCISLYGQGLVDAVCVTNVDVLAPSQRRHTVVVAPTSTSAGADALLATVDSLDKIQWKDLDREGKSDGKIDANDRLIYGLEKSVSEFVFEQALLKSGKSPKDYTFVNLDPAAAATALQTNQPNIQAIMVWNPFVLQTLRVNDKVKVVLNSESIPELVIDCLAVGSDVLEKQGSDRGVKTLLDAFYAVNGMLENKTTRDQTLVDLGEKFCSLDAKDMAICCEQTKFYSSPEKANVLFNSDRFKNETMKTAHDFAVEKGLLDSKLNFSIGFDEAGTTPVVRFTTKYLK